MNLEMLSIGTMMARWVSIYVKTTSFSKYLYNIFQADKLELLEYLDPRNPRHAKQETITLFTLADTDHNNKLSLQELLNKSHIFLSSKMINMSENFHDDF